MEQNGLGLLSLANDDWLLARHLDFEIPVQPSVFHIDQRANIRLCLCEPVSDLYRSLPSQSVAELYYPKSRPNIFAAALIPLDIA